MKKIDPKTIVERYFELKGPEIEKIELIEKEYNRKVEPKITPTYDFIAVIEKKTKFIRGVASSYIADSTYNSIVRSTIAATMHYEDSPRLRRYELNDVNMFLYHYESYSEQNLEQLEDIPEKSAVVGFVGSKALITYLPCFQKVDIADLKKQIRLYFGGRRARGIRVRVYS